MVNTYPLSQSLWLLTFGVMTPLPLPLSRRCLHSFILIVPPLTPSYGPSLCLDRDTAILHNTSLEVMVKWLNHIGKARNAW
jgi:hypothetical protein